MDQEKENILNNLKKSGPGFTVPKAYFEKMEARIEQKMDSNDSNSDIKSDINSDLKSNNKNTFSLDQIGKEHGRRQSGTGCIKNCGKGNGWMCPLRNQRHSLHT